MSLLDPANIPTLITAGAGLLGMWGAHKISARATRKNAKEVAETEAFVRARAMDDRTIARQDTEIEDLKLRLKEVVGDNIDLRKRDRDHITEIDKLRTERMALVRKIINLQEQARGKPNDE